MPDLPTQVPSCFDRADGQTKLPPTGGTLGTPTDSTALIITSPLGSTGPGTPGTPFNPAAAYALIPFNEASASPELERAEQCTITHTFTMSWAEAQARIIGLGRGTIMYDSFGNETRVLSAKIQHYSGEWATLTVICEALSFDTPPDEFQCVPVELGINLIKHPRYFYALDPTYFPADATTLVPGSKITVAQAKQSIILAIQSYQDSPWFPSPSYVNSLVQNNILNYLASNKFPVTTGTGATPTVTVVDATPSAEMSLAIAAAGEIISKLWKQEDNPYLVGYKVTHSQYFFKDPNLGHPEPLLYLNGGGYIENPITQASPGLPDYFGSTNGNYGTGGTIFDLIGQDNPQCYLDPNNELFISFLRQADQVDFQRTWFKVTRTWIGTPIGQWDRQIYAKDYRPPFNADPANNYIVLH